jgi:UDP-glucose 4-epimerase
MTRVLVTGCAGLIGSHLCNYIIDNYPGVTVVGVDNLSGGFKESVHSKVDFLELDLTNKDHQKQIKEKFPFDYVFHCAAWAACGMSGFVRQFNYTQNMLSTAFLISASIEYNVKRFVFTSSMCVYGSENTSPYTEEMIPVPEDPYSISKYACEMDLKAAYKQHQLEYCIIRPHNVFGPNVNYVDPYRNVLAIWMNNILNSDEKEITIYGDGEQKRAFTYISNILPCLWNAAVKESAKNQIINVGGIIDNSINECAHMVKEITTNDNYNPKIVYLEKRYEIKDAWCTYDKSVDILDYKEEVSVYEGMVHMWNWLKEQPKRPKRYFTSYELDKNIYSYWKIKN